MSSCSSVGRARLPNNPLHFHGREFSRAGSLSIGTKRAPSRKLALGHGSDFASRFSSTLFRQGVGYVGQVGASIGLDTRLLPQNLVLRENRKIVREPRPTSG
jgi:hypothetical protein